MEIYFPTSCALHEINQLFHFYIELVIKVEYSEGIFLGQVNQSVRRLGCLKLVILIKTSTKNPILGSPKNQEPLTQGEKKE